MPGRKKKITKSSENDTIFLSTKIIHEADVLSGRMQTHWR